MEQDGFSFAAKVSAARTEQAVRATIQHYGQTEEAFSECHLWGFFLSPGPLPFVCPRSDNHCKPHKENSKKRSFGDLRRVGGPPAGGAGSADRVLCKETIADIILFACGLWERSHSGEGQRGDLSRETMQRQFIRRKSASTGSDGVCLSLIDCRPLRKTDGGTVTAKRRLNGWNG